MAQKIKTAKDLAKRIAVLASDKKAEDIIILDMRKVVNFCDFFVICSGNTARQVKAICDGIEDGLVEDGVSVKNNQAMHKSSWIVFDQGDVVTHIFQKDVREFYNLEHLWQEAKRVSWSES